MRDDEGRLRGGGGREMEEIEGRKGVKKTKTILQEISMRCSTTTLRKLPL